MSDNAERIKSNIDIGAYIQSCGVPLKKEGRLFTACCPFHNEKHASFKVDPEKQIAVCYGACGKAWDVIGFAMAYHRETFPEALQRLADYAHITLETTTPDLKTRREACERLYEIMEFAAQHYAKMLYSGVQASNEALAYLTNTRGLSLDSIGVEGGRVGYAPQSAILPLLRAKGYTDDEMIDAGIAGRSESGTVYDFFHNRIMFPIRDTKGRIVAFSGRAMKQGQEPRYLLPRSNAIFDKSSIIHRMPPFDTRRGLDAVVIVEGSIDPLSALNRGIYNICSLLGKSMSDAQFALLLKTGVKRLIFCLDNDSAGERGLRTLVEKHLHTAANAGIDLYAMETPFGKDPDDCFREHPELWESAVQNARPVTDVLIERDMKNLSPNPTPAEKQTFAAKLLPILKGVNGFVEDDNQRKLAAALGCSLDTIQQWARSQVSVMPKPVTILNSPSSLQITTMELIVLHGILTNDDQLWLDRSNAHLARLGAFPYALAPLSLNDFSSVAARSLMAVINRAVETGVRPIDDYVLENVGTGPLHEVYLRAVFRPQIETMIQGDCAPIEYHEYLLAVMCLRRIRLEKDIAMRLIPGANLPECVQVKNMIARMM